MKSRLPLLTALVLILALLLPSRTSTAAPPGQTDAQLIQIVLVMDVSGSMGTPVYTGIVPEDLLTLLLRMDELTSDPVFIDLEDQIEEAENDPAVQDAQQASSDAYQELIGWITADQGLSLQGIQARIRPILTDAGCEDTSAELMATAANQDQILFYLNADCPPGTAVYVVLAEIAEQVPYLTDPEYLQAREDWQTAFRAYDSALEESGFKSLSDQLEEYKLAMDFQAVEDEIYRLVEVYNIPSRLGLAKNAATNLITISKLDQEKSGRQSEIGLVTFSNQAMFEHGLTRELDQLIPLIQSMQPLQQTNIGAALMMGLDELEGNADPDQPMMVILLSDGHANVGLTAEEILAVIPGRANSSDITICTAGFADIEAEVDFVLLEGLAFQTEGEYLFTNSGAELGSFFAACRDAAAGKELADQVSGVLAEGDIQEIGQLTVDNQVCQISMVLNHLSGTPTLELVDPAGEVHDPEDDNSDYQIRDQVQLFTVDYPAPGVWRINLTNDNASGEDAVFSLIMSTTPCQEGESRPEVEDVTLAELPYLLSSAGQATLYGGLIAAIVLLGGVVVLVIFIRQRRAG